MTDRVCALPDCDGEHRARGLCNRHYLSSRRRWKRAGQPEDWDWTAGASKQRASKSSKARRGQQPAGAAQNFTGEPDDGPGGVRGSPPPAGTPGESESRRPAAAGLLNVRDAIDAALACLPEGAATSWKATLIRLLAETLEEARWAENTQPSAASIKQLWDRMTALEEAHAEEEHDAFDRVGAQLIELLGAAQAEDPQPSPV